MILTHWDTNGDGDDAAASAAGAYDVDGGAAFQSDASGDGGFDLILNGRAGDDYGDDDDDEMRVMLQTVSPFGGNGD